MKTNHSNLENQTNPKTLNHLFKIFLVILWIPMLSGCLKITKKNSDKSEDQTAPSPVPAPVQAENKTTDNKSKPLINSVIKEGDKPLVYFIEVQWKNSFKKVVIQDVLNQNQVLFDGSVSNYSEASVDWKSDAPFKFNIISFDSEYPQVIGTIEGKTPLDIVIEGNKELTQSAQINAERVFFLNAAKLKTNGFDLSINTKKLFTENAEISTFDPDQVKSAGLAANGIDGMNGKSGGKIVITAQEADGSLVVNMRGQNGGDGKNGEPYTERAPGGTPGTPGEVKEIIREIDEHSSVPIFSRANKLKDLECTRVPGKGNKGQRGQNGFRGGNAGHGGSTGVLVAKIDKGSIQVKVIKEFGIAGQIGLGGTGQLGGLGGPGGDRIFRSTEYDKSTHVIQELYPKCPAGEEGEFGEDGFPGENGFPGHDGLQENSCVSIGQEKGNC